MTFDGILSLQSAPPLVQLGLIFAILCLPLAAAIAALMRVRAPLPPRAAWMCILAAIVLFVFWIVPLGPDIAPQVRQLKDVSVIGLYAWVLFDWYRTMREDGPKRIDLLGLCLMLCILICGAYVLLTGVFSP